MVSVVWARTPLDVTPSEHVKMRQVSTKISPMDESEYISLNTVANLEKVTDAAMQPRESIHGVDTVAGSDGLQWGRYVWT